MNTDIRHRAETRVGERHLASNPACPAIVHGSPYAYGKGCLCPEARHRVSVYHKRRRIAAAQGRPYLVPAFGSTRRLRALARDGWSLPKASTHTGLGIRQLQLIRSGDVLEVYGNTAAVIAQVYEDLAGRVGTSQQTVSWARKAGWPGTDAWDWHALDDPAGKPTPQPEIVDEVKVSRAMGGWPVDLSRTERRDAVKRLVARGLSNTQIAELLHTEQRQVERDRTWLRRQREAA